MEDTVKTERLINTKQACEMLGLKTRRTIYRWRKKGILKPVFINNGVRFRLSDIEKLQQEGDS